MLGATALSHAEVPTLQIASLRRSVETHAITLDVIANVYDRNRSVPGALCTVHVKAFKGFFWYQHITPPVVASYDFVWLFDSDMGLAHFALWRVLGAMIKHNASAAQPRIRPHTRRSTDHRHLRVQRECAQCEAQCTDFIEVMTPVFTSDAWTRVYTGLLRLIPRADLRVSIGGIDTRWCAHLSDGNHKSACVVSNTTIVHYDHGTLKRQGMQRSNQFKVFANEGMRDKHSCPFCLRSGYDSCKSFEVPGYPNRRPRLEVQARSTFFSSPSIRRHEL